jgi:hypothetical protein
MAGNKDENDRLLKTGVNLVNIQKNLDQENKELEKFKNQDGEAFN